LGAGSPLEPDKLDHPGFVAIFEFSGANNLAAATIPGNSCILFHSGTPELWRPCSRRQTHFHPALSSGTFIRPAR